MSHLKAVLNRLRKTLGDANSTMDELWQMMMHRSLSDIIEVPERLRHETMVEGMFVAYLEILALELPIALEILGLHETRRDFVRYWRKLDDKSMRKLDEWHNDYGDGIESAPLNQIRRILGMIEAPFEDETTGAERASLEILDHALASTPKVVTRANPSPSCEHDIQAQMHFHLDNIFTSFTPKVLISKPIMVFKPDCGIIDFRAAIEFKFVNSDQELKTALHGLNEDLSAYAGSRDWTKFYSVIYQTGPFGTEKQVLDALKKSGNADRWRVHLVTGPGARVKKVAKK